MLNKNTELLYWRKNKLWYYFDEAKQMYYLTDDAPERAKNSYNLWKQFNNIK